MRVEKIDLILSEKDIQKVVENRRGATRFEREIYYKNGIHLRLLMDFEGRIFSFGVSCDQVRIRWAH